MKIINSLLLILLTSISIYAQTPSKSKTINLNPNGNGFLGQVTIEYAFMDCFGETTMTFGYRKLILTGVVLNNKEYSLTDLDLTNPYKYVTTFKELRVRYYLGNRQIKSSTLTTLLEDYDIGCYGQTDRIADKSAGLNTKLNSINPLFSNATIGYDVSLRWLIENYEKKLVSEKKFKELIQLAQNTESSDEKLKVLLEAKKYTDNHDQLDEEIKYLKKEIKDKTYDKLVSDAKSVASIDEKRKILNEAKKYATDNKKLTQLDNEIENLEKEKNLQMDESKISKADTAEAFESTKETSNDSRSFNPKNTNRGFERKMEYERRKQNQESLNSQIAATSAATTAGVAYLFGGFIYSNYGQVNAENIFTGNNLRANLDIGFTMSYLPLLFASDMFSMGFDGTSSRTQETTLDYPLYINLNLGGQLGYETAYFGGFGLAAVQAGIHPILSGTNFNYNYGVDLFGGTRNFKIFGDYTFGGRQFNNSRPLDSEESGKGRTNYNFKRLNYGVQFSWYGSPKVSARNHIRIGLIEEKITKLDDGISFSNTESQEPIFLQNDEFDALGNINLGYSFEWRHDHHGVLFIEVFPSYTPTGERNGPDDSTITSKGGVFLQVGFLRSLGGYGKSKTKQ